MRSNRVSDAQSKVGSLFQEWEDQVDSGAFEPTAGLSDLEALEIGQVSLGTRRRRIRSSKVALLLPLQFERGSYGSVHGTGDVLFYWRISLSPLFRAAIPI